MYRDVFSSYAFFQIKFVYFLKKLPSGSKLSTFSTNHEIPSRFTDTVSCLEKLVVVSVQIWWGHEDLYGGRQCGCVSCQYCLQSGSVNGNIHQLLGHRSMLSLVWAGVAIRMTNLHLAKHVEWMFIMFMSIAKLTLLTRWMLLQSLPWFPVCGM